MATEIYLGLRSNARDRQKNIEEVIQMLSQKIRDIKVANIYESKPVGFKRNSFLNTVVTGNTNLPVKDLLIFIKELKSGLRGIGIDILFYDKLSYKGGRIEIPHPKLHERDFVLKPLMDLDPNFVHPIFKRTIKQLYSELPKELLSIIGVYGHS